MVRYNYLPIGVRVDFDPVTIKQTIVNIIYKNIILRLSLYHNKSIFLPLFIFFHLLE